MLIKTFLIVFIILSGQFGYIVMSDSGKNLNIYCLKKKIHALFWSRKVKNVKKILFAPRGTCKKWILNKGPFAEVVSTFGPLPLAQLIKSTVAPLLICPLALCSL